MNDCSLEGWEVKEDERHETETRKIRTKQRELKYNGSMLKCGYCPAAVSKEWCEVFDIKYNGSCYAAIWYINTYLNYLFFLVCSCRSISTLHQKRLAHRTSFLVKFCAWWAWPLFTLGCHHGWSEIVRGRPPEITSLEGNFMSTPFFIFSNIFQMKASKHEEKLEFGGRLTWRT